MTPREAAARAEYWEKVWEGIAIVLGSLLLWLGTSDVLSKEADIVWKKFVQVEGQPEPVPEQWVSTPEGRFAHSIRIPNPVPKDSGYRRGMSSEEYFQHLCRTEAGEFIFKTVENVEGFYFMRPPNPPSDDALMSRYRLEDPYMERYYQLRPDRLPDRPAQFVSPPFYNYKFVEEPRRQVAWQRSIATPYWRASGYKFDGKNWKVISEMRLEPVEVPNSAFGYTWRGLRRQQDREHAIAGSELLIFERSSRVVLAVLRNYVLSGRTRNTASRIWWLNAISCPQLPTPYQDNLGKQIYQFVSKVLIPTTSDK